MPLVKFQDLSAYQQHCVREIYNDCWTASDHRRSSEAAHGKICRPHSY
jgi:hypothetical protein